MKPKMLAVALVAVLLLAPLLSVAAYSQTQPVTIKIGALLPLTGDLQSYGQRASAAIEFAVQEMNQYLEEKNAPFRIDVVIENTETKASIAQQKLNAMIAQGIKFVVGPMTSAEVKTVKDAANANKVLIISPSSTAIELAIPGDYVYRFCPADDVQSKAIGVLAKDLGLKAVVIVARADTWGLGLLNATKNVLVNEGVYVNYTHTYDPEAKPFSQIASQLNDEVKQLIDKFGLDKVAVILISFEEAQDLFSIAQNYPTLGKVLWIGSDGTAKTEIIKSPDAAAFAARTLFINPIFSPASTEEQQKVAQYVQNKTGSEPDAYALASHDAVVAITLAILQAPEEYLNNPDQLVDFVKDKIPEIVQSDEFAQFAATGTFQLNEAGDRAIADYDFWIVQQTGGKYDWVKVGTYLGKEDRIQWLTLEGGKTFKDLFQEKIEKESKTGLFGGGAAKIVGAIVVIIIVVAAAYFLTKKS